MSTFGNKPTCGENPDDDIMHWIRFICRSGQWKKSLSWPEAYRIFWESVIGWLLPIQWYKYGTDPMPHSGYIYEHVSRNARKFGFHLHNRGLMPLTLTGYRHLEPAPSGYPQISKELFISIAHKWSLLYRGIGMDTRPFLYVPVEGTGRTDEPAYCIKPDISRLLILGVDPACGLRDDDFDWSLFQTPPDA